VLLASRDGAASVKLRWGTRERDAGIDPKLWRQAPPPGSQLIELHP
jgi:hypothetical protein